MLKEGLYLLLVGGLGFLMGLMFMINKSAISKLETTNTNLSLSIFAIIVLIMLGILAGPCSSCFPTQEKPCPEDGMQAWMKQVFSWAMSPLLPAIFIGVLSGFKGIDDTKFDTAYYMILGAMVVTGLIKLIPTSDDPNKSKNISTFKFVMYIFASIVFFSAGFMLYQIATDKDKLKVFNSSDRPEAENDIKFTQESKDLLRNISISCMVLSGLAFVLCIFYILWIRKKDDPKDNEQQQNSNPFNGQPQAQAPAGPYPDL